MKVFFQGKDESVVINGDITVTILDIDGDDVLLGIDAPAWAQIDGNGPRHAEEEVEEWSPLQPR